jgi:hypothetical protein
LPPAKGLELFSGERIGHHHKDAITFFIRDIDHAQIPPACRFSECLSSAAGARIVLTRMREIPLHRSFGDPMVVDVRKPGIGITVVANFLSEPLRPSVKIILSRPTPATNGRLVRARYLGVRE